VIKLASTFKKVAVIIASTVLIASCDPVKQSGDLETKNIRADVSVVWEGGSYSVKVTLADVYMNGSSIELSDGDKLFVKSEGTATELLPFESVNRLYYGKDLVSDNGSITVEFQRVSGNNATIVVDFGSRINVTIAHNTPFIESDSGVGITLSQTSATTNLNWYLTCTDEETYPEELNLAQAANISTNYNVSIVNVLANYNAINSTEHQWSELADSCSVKSVLNHSMVADPVVTGFTDFSLALSHETTTGLIDLE